MTLSIAAAGLIKHGIRQTSGPPARARTHDSRDVTLISLQGTSHAALSINTRSAHPEHIALVFSDEEMSDPPSRDDHVAESYLTVAPLGAVRNMQYRRRWKLTCALIPRAHLAFQIHPTSHDTTQYFDRRPLDRAMQRFIDAILDSDAEPSSSIETYAIHQILTNMADAVLLDRFGTEDEPNAHSMLRERALEVIAQSYTDPRTTPTRIALELGVSLRLLQGVFTEAGLTVAGEIRRRRAILARTLLVDQPSSGLTMAEITKRAGFATTMTLRRSLVKEFGTTSADSPSSSEDCR